MAHCTKIKGVCHNMCTISSVIRISISYGKYAMKGNVAFPSKAGWYIAVGPLSAA
jgi:hypothetical protein